MINSIFSYNSELPGWQGCNSIVGGYRVELWCHAEEAARGKLTGLISAAAKNVIAIAFGMLDALEEVERILASITS